MKKRVLYALFIGLFFLHGSLFCADERVEKSDNDKSSQADARYRALEGIFQRGRKFLDEGNVQEALYHIRIAAEGKHVLASLAYGHLYVADGLREEGVGDLRKKVVEFLWFAYSQGCKDACSYLGDLYYGKDAEGSSVDYNTAVTLLKEGFESNNRVAIWALAEAVLIHSGLSREELMPLKWARHKGLDAWFFRGLFHQYGYGVIDVDEEAAFNEFARSYVEGGGSLEALSHLATLSPSGDRYALKNSDGSFSTFLLVPDKPTSEEKGRAIFKGEEVKRIFFLMSNKSRYFATQPVRHAGVGACERAILPMAPAQIKVNVRRQPLPHEHTFHGRADCA